MPFVPIPIQVGLGSDTNESDWIDRIPVNMLAVKKHILSEGTDYYLRSFPGLTPVPDHETISGSPRGSVYNKGSDSVFRVFGDQLTDRLGSHLADIGGSGYAAMPYSIEFLEDRDTPIQGVVSGGKLNYYNTRTEELTFLRDWEDGESTRGSGGRQDLSISSARFGPIVDATRNRSRYVWIHENDNRFGVSDLDNFERPDYFAPYYSVGSQIGSVIAVDSWRDYVVTFSRDTIQYFQLTGNQDNIYREVPSLTVRAGIVGRQAKCHFAMGGFAIIGGPEEKPPSIYVANQGKLAEIATRYIQKIVSSYTEQQLSEAILEPVKFYDHELLLIHLPNHVLCYDSSLPETHIWTELTSSADGRTPYRGIYHVYDGYQWSAADKLEFVLSNFNQRDSSQNGDAVTHIIYSQMLQLRNASLFDLEIDGVFGQGDIRMAISTTTDGAVFGQEQWVDYSSNLERNNRILFRRLGYCYNNIGFRLRILSEQPVTVSNLRVRAEGGQP